MKFACIALILVLALGLGLPSRLALAFDEPRENLITMNFQDVDIAVLTKFISEITGRNFILDESVRGKVSVISPTKVTPEQAYNIFQSVLQIKGFTTVQAGSVIKIVPARVVRESATLTQSQEPAASMGDEYVTRMIKLRNVDATSLVNVVQPMISRDGLVAAFPETNTLIVTDESWNVQRLLQIIGSLDQQGIQQTLTVIPLKLAYADDIAPKIEQIMAERGGGAGVGLPRPGQGVVAPSAQAPSRAFKVVPDERTNSLIVLAGPLQMKQIKDLVDQLDVHSPSATSRVHVYYLRYAQALEMVSVLGALVGGGSGPGQLSPVTGRGSLGRGGSGMSGSSFGSMGGGFGGSSMMNSGFGSSSMGSMSGGFGGSMGGGFGSSMGGGFGSGMGGGGMRGSSSGGGGSASVSGTGGPGTEFESPVKVTADPATNALVISASPQDYETIKHIISQIDIPRRQVFVQAIIAEVSVSRERDLGINFQGATAMGNTLGFSQLNFGTLTNAFSNPLSLSGLTFGVASQSMCTVSTGLSALTSGTTTSTTTATSVSVPCDIALITALETDTHTNVLSAPTLLTSDNEEATIVVGQNVPFLSSATATSALNNQIFNSVNRQNVGITLDIVPQTTADGYIQLDIYEEVSALEGNTLTNPLGPTTTIRSASTTVLVQNHRTTVIGGLLADQNENDLNGTPFLSSIPVLGNLFSATSRQMQKTNLLVFLTPHVIRDREDLRELSLDERQKFLQRLGRHEVHDMPLVDLRELYNPAFSVAVPPGAERSLSTTPSEPGAPEEPTAPPEGSSYSPTPLNTEEINSPRASVGAPAVAGTAISGSSGLSNRAVVNLDAPALERARSITGVSATSADSTSAPAGSFARPPRGAAMAADTGAISPSGSTAGTSDSGLASDSGSSKAGGELDAVGGLYK